MSIRDPIRNACAYIEAHLTDEIGFADVARAVAFSPYYFHRLFQGAVGESITEHIRRRRLTEAAAQLTAGRLRIIDIAVTYRFESQASFTKAFRRMYGITPGAYRRKGVHRIMTEGIETSAETTEHGIRREPQIVELPERLMVGLSYIGKNQNGEIPLLWAGFNQRWPEVQHVAGSAVGYCEVAANPKEEGEFGYVAGVIVSRVDLLPEGMVSRKLPAGLYAVFTHETGLANLAKSYEYIWGKWLPASNYEAQMTHDYELYDERFDPRTGSGAFELHVPIKARS
ncbi:MAG TPA: AraC family transcriptional regulator [Symbiobacteriaceae bacterium]|nr:AraC family transcriptional regulator [Symbiobacteriaceae bacterium]